MKKGLFIIITSLFLLVSLQAQQVQWASKLIKFSSDLGGKQNGIKRILGQPDAFPQGGSSANAWTPKKALDGHETVEVGFEKPQMIKQVAVFENLNAGCVVKISVADASGDYQTVWSRRPNYKTPVYKTTLTTDRSYYFKRKRRKVQEAPEVINPGIEYAILENSVANVVAVKVEFNFALLPGAKQIDAIGISDSEVPMEAKINTNPIFENLLNPESLEFDNIEVSNVIVSQDGKKMFYSALESEKDVVFSSEKQADGKWSKPIAEPSLSLNDEYNYLEYYDSNFILKGGVEYTRNTPETGFEFFENKNGSYQAIKSLKITAYNNYDDVASASITADQKTLIMGIESDMTQGGMDLYFTTRKEDGTYGFLQNMGKTINSAADEGMPQLLSDTKTLLFSSNGFSSFGDFDIYVSHRLDDTWKKWSEPVNLGSKINNSDYEGSPFYDEKTETLYFTKWVNNKPKLSFVKISLVDLVKL